MGLPKSTNVRFDNLTPQFEIPSTSTVYNLLNEQTSVQRTSIVANGSAVSRSGSTGWIFPLPVNFNYKKYYMWNQKDHDFIKYKASEFLADNAETVANSNSLKDAVSGIFDNTKNEASAILDEVKKVNAETGVNATLYLLQKKYGSDIETVNYQMGRTINPLRKLYFQGMDLRTFDFSFDLIPQNESENKKFLSSYKALKLAATPTINPNEIFYNYPCKFSVSISVDYKTVFTLSNLRCVNAGFNMNEMKFRADGLPNVYNITLTFQESEVADQSVESTSGFMPNL